MRYTAKGCVGAERKVQLFSDVLSPWYAEAVEYFGIFILIGFSTGLIGHLAGIGFLRQLKG